MGGLNGEIVKCPGCGSELLQKYGKTPAGKQKYRCMQENCRRQFVAGSTHRIDQGVKDIVIGLLKQNVSPAKISKSVPGISLRRIRELRREIAL